MGIVFVDVDGTLLDGPGSERLFLGHLLAHRVIGPRHLARAARFVATHGWLYGRHVFKKNKAYLCGLDVAEVTELAADFARCNLVPRLRPRVLLRLARHRGAGETIALLTGTPDFIAAPLAGEIGATLTLATRCAQENGRFRKDPPDVHPFALEKALLASDICASRGVPLTSCAAYADSMDDVPLLRRVGRPVAVHPDRKLERIAENEGWEILAGPRLRDRIFPDANRAA